MAAFFISLMLFYPPHIILHHNLVPWTVRGQLILQVHRSHRAASPHLIIWIRVFSVSPCLLNSPAGVKASASICVAIVLVCLEVGYTSESHQQIVSGLGSVWCQPPLMAVSKSIYTFRMLFWAQRPTRHVTTGGFVVCVQRGLSLTACRS